MEKRKFHSQKLGWGKRIGQVLLHGVVFPFVASFVALILSVVLMELWIFMMGAQVWASLITFLGVGLIYYLLRRIVDLEFVSKMSGIFLAVYSLLFMAFMIAGKGNIEGTVVSFFTSTCIQFLPLIVIYGLTGAEAEVAISVLCYFLILMFCAGWGHIKVEKEKDILLVVRNYMENGVSAEHEQLDDSNRVDRNTKGGGKLRRFVVGVLAIALVTCAIDGVLYMNRSQARYAGHGFDYMNGYSSTDFKDYMVYAENSKLVTLDHEASFQIEHEEDMPILDGAEACYPLYAAFAKAVYKDIDVIEKEYKGSEDAYYMYEENGKIIAFSNTLNAFMRLVDCKDEEKIGSKVDIYFGAKPSEEQFEMARELDVKLEVTPIGKEAFVFFVEKDNPIDNLTSEQIRAIYHGDITNWKELGGKDQKIVAFQRPHNSGSQTMMEYFMGDVSLKEPMTYETVDAMSGVIQHVAQYANEDGAMGYTFRYFLEGLSQEKGVKMLSVDGVYPTIESVKDGSYPLSVPLVVVTRRDDENPNVQKMVDFILSEDGQYIVEQTGYAPLSK